MNTFEKTKYKALENDCLEFFGENQGKYLYNKILEKYNKYLESIKSINIELLEKHFKPNLLPIVSCYKVLLENNYNSIDALNFSRQLKQKAALEEKQENEKFCKLPFAYNLYKMFAKKHMIINYPAEGFCFNWEKYDKNEICFNMTKCIYYDFCKEEDIPELCTVFCESDIIAFSGLMPKIKFKRENTLSGGCAKCDFHFIKNKKK